MNRGHKVVDPQLPGFGGKQRGCDIDAVQHVTHVVEHAGGDLGHAGKAGQFLRAPAIGNVGVRPRYPIGCAVLVAKGLAPRQNPRIRTVLVPEPVLNPILGRLAFQIALQVFHHARPVVGMEMLLEGGEGVGQLVVLVADHAFPLRREELRVGPQVPVPNAVVAGVDGQHVLFPALLQLRGTGPDQGFQIGGPRRCASVHPSLPLQGRPVHPKLPKLVL